MNRKPVAWAAATLIAVAVPNAWAASDPEIQALREELARLKADYERRIDALERRLAESGDGAAAVSPRPFLQQRKRQPAPIPSTRQFR